MNWEAVTVVLLIAAGGAIGAVLRYAVAYYADSSSFPWATFIVNIIGSFFICLIFFALGQTVPDTTRYFLFIGVFGAFTTMSTFTLETVALFADGRFAVAAINWFANALLCLVGAFAGRYVAMFL